MMSIYCQSISEAGRVEKKINLPEIKKLYIVDDHCVSGRMLRDVLSSQYRPLQDQLIQVQHQLDDKSSELSLLMHHHRISATLMRGSKAISDRQYQDFLTSSKQSIQAAKHTFSLIEKQKQSLLLRRQAVTDWMHTNWFEIGKVILSMQSFIGGIAGSGLAVSLLDSNVLLLSQRFDQPISQIVLDSKTYLSCYHSMWQQINGYFQAASQSVSANDFTKTFRILVSDQNKQAMMHEFLMSYVFLIPHSLTVFVDAMSPSSKDFYVLSSKGISNTTNDYYALSSVFTQLPIVSLEDSHEDSSECQNLCLVM